MALNKKSVDDINVKGKRVLVRCDFNVPLKGGEITDDTRIKAALPTIQKLLKDGGKVILCSHLGKVKNGPNEGESLAPVAKRLEEVLGQKVSFVSDYNVTGEAATKAVEEMKEGDVVLLQNTRFRGAEETKNGEEFSKELAALADVYVCVAFFFRHFIQISVSVIATIPFEFICIYSPSLIRNSPHVLPNHTYLPNQSYKVQSATHRMHPYRDKSNHP